MNGKPSFLGSVIAGRTSRLCSLGFVVLYEPLLTQLAVTVGTWVEQKTDKFRVADILTTT